ncbi:unnamed protein product [Mytilus edulis]|uniref:Uncharacterized protein n=1 Tax=Mytilus edulis TaxID=6550 RepID=A0A8S3PM29_MYTED|nr:unnamed protein product [Mytilus edulis]
MDSKLKSVRAGHKGAVTKLLVKFDELKSKTDTEVDEVEALDDAVTQKQKTLIDLNNRLLEQTSEENLEQEITDSDEYMYELDCKIRQIRKFIKSFETNTIISHDTVGPSTSRLNPDAYHFTPEARVDMNRCAIDSMNQQYSINAPAMTPECGSLTLQHHMLGPVQRIPRYEMLLKDYLRRLPEDAADREDAQVALELVTTAACHSNEAMKKIDSFNKLLEIMRKIDTSENLISPTRELVREGRIIKISARGGERLERFLFLFNDLMLICFEPLLGSYKIKSQLEMDGMEILEGESIDIPNTFYVKSRQKIIQFLDENSNGEPSGWCETIRKAIEKYKRRQSLKSTEIQRNSKGMTDVELGKVAPKWIKDDEVTMCMKCTAKFTALRRRHHCRACGDVVCGRCSSKKVPLRYDNNHLNRVCDDCYHLLRNDEEEPVTPTHDKSSTKKKNILQINASDPSVLSGYLHTSTDKGKSWHRRWVAVHHNFVISTLITSLLLPAYAVIIFTILGSLGVVTSLPLPGHVVEDVDKVEHLDRENLFKISHKRTNLYLSSETTASKERWMHVLSKVVMAEIPEDVEDISKRDSSHSTSSNESFENTESEQSHL